jgi:hypothetical protein
MAFFTLFFICICLIAFEAPSFAADTDRAAAVLQRELGVTLGGGDGSSFEKAILVHGPSVETATVAMYEYIALRYRLWQFERIEILRYKGKVYNVLTYYDVIPYRSFPDWKKRVFYFDISEYISKKPVAVAVSHLSGAPPPDPEATRLLVGIWFVPRKEYAFTSKDGDFKFRADGTFSSFSVYRFGQEDVRVEVEGKWTIKNGVLMEKLTKSNRPLIAPVGALTRDTLLTVTNNQYRFRDDRGDEHTYVRK